MNVPQQPDPQDPLSKAYEKMFKRVIQKFHDTENKTAQLINQLIDEAREKAVELKEVSEEEANKLTMYLKRDLNDASTFLAQTGHELEDWLGFKTSLLESGILYQLLQAADKTTLELLKIKGNAENASLTS